MVCRARSSTTLAWGVPAHPAHLLRAIKTHSRLQSTIKTLRGCHLFAPDPPASSRRPVVSIFTVTTPAAPFAGIHPTFTKTSFTFTALDSPPYPDTSTSDSRRKGIASLPVEILGLIELEVVLSAHEEDEPRSLLGALERSSMHSADDTVTEWKRVCVCGERYVETGDVLVCWEKLLAEVKSHATQKYLLKHFGLTTAVVSTPLKHSIVLLVLPQRVFTLPAPKPTMHSLPIHPPLPKKILSTFPRHPGAIAGRAPSRYKKNWSASRALPPPVVPLRTPSDGIAGHMHPAMFAPDNWRLRNQHAAIRASIVDPNYLLLGEEKLWRFRWCVEKLVLWKAVNVAREGLGYEELGAIEHFEMCRSASIRDVGGGYNDKNRARRQDWLGLHDEVIGSEGSVKRVKLVEEVGSEELKVRERGYWAVAIRPEMWLLEEVGHEP